MSTLRASVSVPMRGFFEGGGGGEEGTLRKWVVSLEQSAYTLFLFGINSFKASVFYRTLRVSTCPCTGGREKPLDNATQLSRCMCRRLKRYHFIFLNKNKFGGRKCESFGVTKICL